jgi:hypothetical protein
MEKFRLRVRHTPAKGTMWELYLVPDRPLAASGSDRLLGSVSTVVSINWLREIARPFFERLDTPRDIDGFSARSEPVCLAHEDGMRLALAFSAARYLIKARQRRQFRDGLLGLPSEVVIYWFTLCFYGERIAAARAALRTLLAYEEPPPPRKSRKSKKRSDLQERMPFSATSGSDVDQFD